MNVSLYEVSHDLRALLDDDDSFDPETGELSEALQSAIGAVKNKGAAVIAYMLNREGEAALIADAIGKMQKRKQAADARVAALKRYLAENMKVSGITEITALDGSFKAKLYADRDEAIVIDDDKSLDDALCVTKTVTTRTPDKSAIKAAIKSGQPVAGARLVRRDRLTIA